MSAVSIYKEYLSLQALADHYHFSGDKFMHEVTQELAKAKFLESVEVCMTNDSKKPS